VEGEKPAVTSDCQLFTRTINEQVHGIELTQWYMQTVCIDIWCSSYERSDSLGWVGAGGWC